MAAQKNPGQLDVISGISQSVPYSSPTLAVRLAALALLFGLELLAFSIQTGDDFLIQHGGFVARLHPGHVWRAISAFFALSIAFGFILSRPELGRISRSLEAIPVRWGRIVGHFCALGIFDVLSNQIANGSNSITAVAWLVTGVVALILAWTALFSWRVSLQLLDSARGAWIVAALGAIFAVEIEDFRRLLWERVIGLTVSLVQIFLHPFVPDLVVNRTAGTFASHSFRLIITPECAGFEGAGLMLAFSIAWLVLFRKECRYPQALLLIPMSVIVAWLLNSVRLAVLFLIGHAGAPGIALGGFHSQAGWIAFSGLALGFTLMLQYVPGLKKEATIESVSSIVSDNPTASYLMPFLGILATAMITRAVSAHFDWLYPLRFAVAALILIHYRRHYASLDWRFGWPAAVAGIAVFGIWLGLEHVAPSASASGIASGLAAWSPGVRMAWIGFRTLGALVTVPIAEELAFRGFLLRRIVSADFENVGAENFTLVSLAISSIAFGLLHGDRWLAGTLAGLFYALALRRRGRFGDAVVAHMITNGLLAIWVLLTGNWQLW